jgi:hypothetical protein
MSGTVSMAEYGEAKWEAVKAKQHSAQFALYSSSCGRIRQRPILLLVPHKKILWSPFTRTAQ